MPERVRLHVYDLSQGLARNMSMSFLGVHIDIIPHTGIVCYGNEYFFSGGIQVQPEVRAKCHASISARPGHAVACVPMTSASMIACVGSLLTGVPAHLRGRRHGQH